MATVEVHFQEGFVGQAVSIHVEEEVVASLESLTTRLMIGLAEIVTLDVQDGTKVVIRIGGSVPLTGSFMVDGSKTYVTVSVVNQQVELALVEAQPGYL